MSLLILSYKVQCAHSALTRKRAGQAVTTGTEPLTLQPHTCPAARSSPGRVTECRRPEPFPSDLPLEEWSASAILGARRPLASIPRQPRGSAQQSGSSWSPPHSVVWQETLFPLSIIAQEMTDIHASHRGKSPNGQGDG